MSTRGRRLYRRRIRSRQAGGVIKPASGSTTPVLVTFNGDLVVTFAAENIEPKQP